MNSTQHWIIAKVKVRCIFCDFEFLFGMQHLPKVATDGSIFFWNCWVYVSQPIIFSLWEINWSNCALCFLFGLAVRGRCRNLQDLNCLSCEVLAQSLRVYSVASRPLPARGSVVTLVLLICDVFVFLQVYPDRPCMPSHLRPVNFHIRCIVQNFHKCNGKSNFLIFSCVSWLCEMPAEVFFVFLSHFHRFHSGWTDNVVVNLAWILMKQWSVTQNELHVPGNRYGIGKWCLLNKLGQYSTCKARNEYVMVKIDDTLWGGPLMLERRFALPLIVEGLWDTLVSVSWMFDSGSSRTWHQAYLGTGGSVLLPPAAAATAAAENRRRRQVVRVTNFPVQKIGSSLLFLPKNKTQIRRLWRLFFLWKKKKKKNGQIWEENGTITYCWKIFKISCLSGLIERWRDCKVWWWKDCEMPERTVNPVFCWKSLLEHLRYRSLAE